jgi:hypothetical protein
MNIQRIHTGEEALALMPVMDISGVMGSFDTAESLAWLPADGGLSMVEGLAPGQEEAPLPFPFLVFGDEDEDEDVEDDEDNFDDMEDDFDDDFEDEDDDFDDDDEDDDFDDDEDDDYDYEDDVDYDDDFEE